jgi:hypothetical protein
MLTHIARRPTRAIRFRASQGSGSNGDNGIFRVGSGLPTSTGNTIDLVLGGPATDPVSGEATAFTPFGFWFANPTTLCIADEGNPNTDEDSNIIVDPMAGVQKWTLAGGVWTRRVRALPGPRPARAPRSHHRRSVRCRRQRVPPFVCASFVRCGVSICHRLVEALMRTALISRWG